MTKLGKLQLLVLLGILIASGCSDKTLVQDKLYDENPEQIVLSPTGETRNIVLTFGAEWSADSIPDWIICSKNKGKNGTNVISISANVNRTEAVRDATLTFKAKDNTTISIPVHQDYPYLRTRIEKAELVDNTLSFLWNHSQENPAFSAYSVVVESNVDWRVMINGSTGVDNFYISKNNGTGNAQLTLTTKQNNLDKTAYDAVLLLEALMPGSNPIVIGEGVDSPIFYLHQNNLRFLLNDGVDDVEVSIDELNEIIQNGEITIDSELPWSVVGGLEWVNMSETSHSAEVCTVSVAADGVNPTLDERNHVVVLRSSGGAERRIAVRQDPFVFNLSKSAVAIRNQGQEEQLFSLNTSGPWEILNAPEWLTVIPEKGEERGTCQISLNCDNQNLDLEDKLVKLQFRSTLNGIVQTTEVSQDKFVFDIEQNSKLLNISPINTDLYPVQITSSGDWSLKASDTWVELSSVAGSMDASVWIGAKSNNPDMEKARSATITMVSETHKAQGITLERELAIIQTEFKFEISTSATRMAAYSGGVTLNIVCSGEWEIISLPKWLTADRMSGLEDKSVKINASTNTSLYDVRKDRITVRSKYNNVTKQSDELVQDKFVFNISENINSTFSLPTVDVPEQSFTLNCTDNAPWTLSFESNEGSWIKRSDASGNNGSGSKNLRFRIDSNPSRSSRQGTIRVACEEIDKTYSINFSQSSYEFYVQANDSYSSLNPLGEQSFTIPIQCSSSWTIVSSDSSWAHVDKATGKGNDSVTLTIDQNVNDRGRNATVIIYSDLQRGTDLENEFKKVISIEQLKYTFDLLSESSRNFSPIPEDNAFDVMFNCSGKWAVKGDYDSMVTINNKEGEGNGSFRISVKDNLNLESRSCSVILYSRDNEKLTKQITVSQDRFVFDVDTTDKVVSSSDQTLTVTVKCTTQWSAKSNDEDWISVSDVSDSSMKITIKKNGTKKDRTGTITVKSSKDHSKTIKITQSK